MNRLIYLVSMILQILLCSTAFVLNYFTTTKMGMARHVIYLNNKWEAAYPIPTIQIISIVVLLILLVIGIALTTKVKSQGILLKGICITNIITTFIYIGMTLLGTTEKLKSYYIFCILFAIVAFIQNTKVIVATQRIGKNSAE